MIEIPLDHKFRIQGDSKCWILSEQQGKRWIPFGFYTDLENLLRAFLDMKSRTCDAKSISELVLFQKSLIAGLNEALQPLKFEIVRIKS